MKTKLSLVVLLALLAVPMAAATSISFDTGTFQSGRLTGAFANRHTLDVFITGSSNTLEVKTGALTAFTAGCPAGSTCFLFSSGVASVAKTGTVLFSDSLIGGLIIEADGSASISATLMPRSNLTSGNVAATFDFTGTNITGGSGDVAINQTAVVPEPASLLLFGSGVLGMGIAKFRHRLTRLLLA